MTDKSLACADAIFRTIGINDLAQGKKAGLDDRYRKIVETLPGKTPLIWSAVMPARSNQKALPDIQDANQTIKRLCSSRRNYVFVDTWNLLADKNGRMNSSLFINDGIHLSPAGYGAWIHALKQAVQHFSSSHDAPNITRNAVQ